MRTNPKLLLLAGIAALCSCTPSPKNAEAEKAVSGAENQVVETIMARRSIREATKDEALWSRDCSLVAVGLL